MAGVDVDQGDVVVLGLHAHLQRKIGIMHPEGVGDRLEVCDTDSLIKESKDSTADWSG